MGYSLIWIESLASALLLAALLVAWSARAPRRWQRWLTGALVPLLVALAAVALTWTIGWFQFSRRLQIGWFGAALAWTLAYVAGWLLLTRRGWRGTEAASLPAAQAWPLGKLALALAVLVIITWTTFSNMDVAMKMQLNGVRAEAGAMTLSRMPPRVLDRDNAALVYQEAFAAMTPPDKVPPRLRVKDLWFDLGAKKWSVPTMPRSRSSEPLDPKDKELQDFVTGQQRALALLRQAASMPACWFDHDYLQSVDMLLPEIDQLRAGAFLLGLDALHQAAQGNSRVALQDVAAMFGIARHINEPILISFLVAAATEKTASKVLENVLALSPPKLEDLAVIALDERVSYRRDFHRACLMEEYGLGLAFIGLAHGQASGGPTTRWLTELLHVEPIGTMILQSSFYRVFFLPDDLAGYRRTMKKLAELASQPYYESAEGWRRFDEELRDRPPGVLTMLITPAADKCAPVAAEADAARQMSRVALALTAYRLKTGQYPAKLDMLVPEYLDRVPVDPCDGRPMRYRLEAKEALLYSVGRNLKDDGGMDWDAATGQGDLVLHLPQR